MPTGNERTDPSSDLYARILGLLSEDSEVRGKTAVDLLTNPPAADALTDRQKADICTRIALLLKGPEIWQYSWFLGVFFASLVQHYCDPLTGSRLMLRACETATDTGNRDEAHYNLVVFCFSHNIDLHAELTDIFFRRYRDWFGDGSYPRLDFVPRRDRAILLTNQILRPPHQPTVDAIKIAHILQDRFGYETAIVNSNELPGVCNLPVFDRKVSNRNPHLSGFQLDRGQNLRVFTPPCEMPSREGFLHLFSFVQSWRPAFVFNFGSAKISAEYLGQYTKMISMQTGNGIMATRTSRAVVAYHEPTAPERDMIARIGMEHVRLVRTNYHFAPPRFDTTYARADFDLRAEDYVIAVVGNRLSTELDDANLALLQAVLELDARIRIVFIGAIDEDIRQAFLRRLPAAQVRFTGFLEDVPSFYVHISDLYLNPRREGGAGSAAYALAAGIPAYSLKFGHICDTTDPRFLFDSREDLLAAIRAAIHASARDPGHTAERQWALEQFGRISSPETMLREILTGADVPTEVSPAPAPVPTALAD